MHKHPKRGKNTLPNREVLRLDSHGLIDVHDQIPNCRVSKCTMQTSPDFLDDNNPHFFVLPNGSKIVFLNHSPAIFLLPILPQPTGHWAVCLTPMSVKLWVAQRLKLVPALSVGHKTRFVPPGTECTQWI